MLIKNCLSVLPNFRAAVAVAALLSSSWAGAAVIVGDPAIDRAKTDTYTNFVITLPEVTFASDGTFDQWSVYTSVTGALGLLVLHGPIASPTVVTSISQTVAATGLSVFDLASPVSVSASDYLGIWMGGGKVVFDFAPQTTPYSPNGAYVAMPGTGDTLNLTSSVGVTSRNYSINVRFSDASTAVPVPATLPLLGLGLAGLAMMGRRRSR